MSTRTNRTRAIAATIAAAVGLSLFGLAVPAGATPPGIPDAATARGYLDGLTVAPDGSMGGYDRDKFPHWSNQKGNCDTREDVLKRDGEKVATGEDCYPTEGSWTSAYDGKTTSEPAKVQIDHVVPLADAWRSGADDWSQDRRESFANELSAPQLIGVSAPSNESKGDQTPDEWMPPKKSYGCTYAEMFVAVKHEYKLTVSDAEHDSLATTLGGC